MKLFLSDINSRLETDLDRYMGVGVNGLVSYGEENNYPDKIERVVLGSESASSVRRVLSSFISGLGFENEAINNIVIGYDSNRRPITMQKMLNKISDSIAIFHGFYILATYGPDQKIRYTNLLPFKNCRIGKIDNSGYFNKLGFAPNGIEDTKKGDWVEYFSFNPDKKVLSEQDNKPQLYNGFIDNSYVYPLSVFDGVYLNCDTEAQIQLFRNNQIRNGFSKKTIMYYVEPDTKEEREQLDLELASFASPTGSNFLAMPVDFDPENGNVQESSSTRVEQFEDSISDSKFLEWDDRIASTIRKAAYNCPALLVDYEKNQMGGTSGEAFKIAIDTYNVFTEKIRSTVSGMLFDIYSNFDNEVLQNEKEYKIKPLMIEQKTE